MWVGALASYEIEKVYQVAVSGSALLASLHCFTSIDTPPPTASPTAAPLEEEAAGLSVVEGGEAEEGPLSACALARSRLFSYVYNASLLQVNET